MVQWTNNISRLTEESSNEENVDKKIEILFHVPFVLDDKPRLQIQMVALNHFYSIELAPSEFKRLCLIKNLLRLINCQNGSQTIYPYKIGTDSIENAD